MTRRSSGRQQLSALIGTIFLLSGAFFFAHQLDAARYAFAPAHEARSYGDVIDLVPEQLPHNTYVTVHGITEHRGLRQRGMRGLNWRRDELWTYRLLGSRGIFINVVADANRYTPMREVTVSGRVVDPAHAPQYAQLLHDYDALFATSRRPQARIIEVGIRPGEGRMPYGAAAVALGLVASLQGIGLVRLLRRRLHTS